MTPTPFLRFVERRSEEKIIPGPSHGPDIICLETTRILQQWWSEDDSEFSNSDKNYGEWRDVPMEKE